MLYDMYISGGFGLKVIDKFPWQLCHRGKFSQVSFVENQVRRKDTKKRMKYSMYIPEFIYSPHSGGPWFVSHTIP